MQKKAFLCQDSLEKRASFILLSNSTYNIWKSNLMQTFVILSKL